MNDNVYRSTREHKIHASPSCEHLDHLKYVTQTIQEILLTLSMPEDQRIILSMNFLNSEIAKYEKLMEPSNGKS